MHQPLPLQKYSSSYNDLGRLMQRKFLPNLIPIRKASCLNLTIFIDLIMKENLIKIYEIFFADLKLFILNIKYSF